MPVLVILNLKNAVDLLK